MMPDARVHIAEINLPQLYAPVFRSLEESAQFCDAVKGLPPSKNDAKVILHQGGRMVWLGDRIDEVARGRPAFQILFYIIAAELVAKIAKRFKGKGQSEKYVQKFFSDICSDEHRQRLSTAFRQTGNGAYLSLETAVKLLYAVRCDVVHRGQYYKFSLARQEFRGMLTSLREWAPIAEITLPELRQIILEGTVLGTKLVAGI